MAKESTQADIQRTSARMRRLVSVLVASLALLLILERFSALTLRMLHQGVGPDDLRRFGFELIAACPEVLYLLSLWWIRQALAAFAEGKLYTPTIAQMLSRVGAVLAIGAGISVFLVPSASKALGFGPGYVIAYDVSGLVLGGIGLSLRVIAHVFRRAAEMQAELDEIF